MGVGPALLGLMIWQERQSVTITGHSRKGCDPGQARAWAKASSLAWGQGGLQKEGLEGGKGQESSKSNIEETTGGLETVLPGNHRRQRFEGQAAGPAALSSTRHTAVSVRTGCGRPSPGVPWVSRHGPPSLVPAVARLPPAEHSPNGCCRWRVVLLCGSRCW